MWDDNQEGVDGPHSTKRGSRAEGLRVLVVDDEPRLARMVADMVRSLGAEAASVSDGSLAVQMLVDEPACVDIVLSDVCMPGMSGWEVLDAIRQVSSGRPAVILSSGLVRESDACKHHPDAFLPKPYSLRHLAEAIQKAWRVSGERMARAPLAPVRSGPRRVGAPFLEASDDQQVSSSSRTASGRR